MTGIFLSHIAGDLCQSIPSFRVSCRIETTAGYIARTRANDSMYTKIKYRIKYSQSVGPP